MIVQKETSLILSKLVSFQQGLQGLSLTAQIGTRLKRRPFAAFQLIVLGWQKPAVVLCTENRRKSHPFSVKEFCRGRFFPEQGKKHSDPAGLRAFLTLCRGKSALQNRVQICAVRLTEGALHLLIASATEILTNFSTRLALSARGFGVDVETSKPLI